MVQHIQINNVIQYINRSKDKNHITISIDAEKPSTSLHDKSSEDLKKLGLEGSYLAGCWWFMPAILATWKADIRRTAVQGHPEQVVPKTPISKITTAK
jgi:hypothetical protein